LRSFINTDVTGFWLFVNVVKNNSNKTTVLLSLHQRP